MNVCARYWGVYSLICVAGLASAAVPGFDATAAFDAARRFDASQQQAEQTAFLKRLAIGRGVNDALMCYPEGTTEEQIESTRLRNPTFDPRLSDERYFTVPAVWTGAGLQTTPGQAAAASLTYSFPSQGTAWGRNQLNPNDLGSGLAHIFGGSNYDLAREHFRQSLAAWRRIAGLTFTEVADDNAPLDNSPTRVTTRGDLRFGGGFDWPDSYLAYNFYPAFGGEGFYNGRYWESFFNSSANSYRLLRNTIIHEVGHGLGFAHVVPCNQVFVMEPFLSSAFDGVQTDDLRNANRNYGDRFAGNNSAATARNFGNLTSPSVRSIIERTLSTNGSAGPSNTDEDWFRFTTGSVQNVTISVTPTGGSYLNGPQSFDCSGSTSTVSAVSAGNLNLELRNDTGTTIRQTAPSTGSGASETLTASNLPGGTYTVRVFDSGPNFSVDQVVQTYDLSIRVGTSKAPPTAIAGVNKRIMSGQVCAFIGDINSYVNEPGATITQYDWDLDGNGSFEVLNNPRPTTTYISTGTRVATLRVTDSNGMTDTDAINVEVFQPRFTLNAALPYGIRNAQGTTVPITLFGTFLSSVTSLSQISVAGAGTTITGTPTLSPDASQITGLSLQFAADAPKGPRIITLTTATGTTSAVCYLYPRTPTGFTITSPSNGSTAPFASPVIQWTSSGPDVYYTVQISASSTFSTLVTGSSSLYRDTRWQVPFTVLSPSTDYWVRVQATNETGVFVTTPVVAFRTGTSQTNNNNACSAAAVVTSAGAAFNTLVSSTDGPNEPSCDSGGVTLIENDVWFAYTAACTGSATFSVCGADYDSFIAVYQDGCPGLGGVLIGCNDDFCAPASQVTADVTAGTTYRIRIGGWGSSRGAGVLNVTCVSSACPGDGDGNRIVNFLDITNVLANFGSTVTPYTSGDTDGTGTVAFLDITTVLANFGNVCQ